VVEQPPRPWRRRARLHASGATAEQAETLAERLKERIYATLSMVAVVIGLAQGQPGTHRGAAGAVAATAVSLWLATVVADEQAHRRVHHRLARGHELRRILFVTSPLLLSAVGPLTLIGLSALGELSLQNALLVSAWISVTGLFVLGYLGGLQLGGGALGGLLAGLVDAGIGCLVVSVKLFAGH